MPSALLSGYRLLFAAALLSPLFWLAWRRHRGGFAPRDLWRCLIPGALLAVHFISWAWGARLTYVANASLIINLTPIVMPFLAHFLIRERVSRIEVAGTLVATAGVAALSWNAFRIDPQFLLGNVVCFGSMIAFAAYLAYGRINKDFPSIWLYMIPVYVVAAFLCFLYSCATLPTLALGSWSEAGLMLAMAILPTTLGHIALNRSFRYFAAQTVAVVNLHQFVFAGVMGWLVFFERPPLVFYFASALCVAGAVIVVREAARIRKLEREAALRQVPG